ncbi:ParB/RepB/Spo0J family partition protein [Anderseniella sp. Alg231-50]|uniref:ParB/RepB/Spo0J family partition protein n=1 Tax=Anderseniella sp. Alg231-50 TaxID=1922226 RepID=UPI000D561368
MTALPKKRLGRGLAALIGDGAPAEAATEQVPGRANGLRELPIELVQSNTLNPRKVFNEEDLEDLVRSVAEKGILQPVVVRPVGEEENYQIVAGERRWRAAQKAGLHHIPALVRELTDKEVLEIALIENVQRADLNPVEEAHGYQQLIDQFDYTQQQLAESIGKSRSHIANTLRLMALPASVLEALQTGKLTAGHARALIATQDPQSLAQKIIALGLSVRQAEALARDTGTGTASKPAKEATDTNIAAVEKLLAEALGLKVSIAAKSAEKGKLTIHYNDLDQLDTVCSKLGIKS